MRKLIPSFEKKHSSSRSLITTLAISFLALSVGAVLFAGVLQTFFNFQAQQTAVSDRQHLIAQEASSVVAGFVQDKFSVMETTLELSNLAQISTTTQLEVLDNLLVLQPAFRHLVLFDAQGRESAKVSDLSRVAVERFVAQLQEDNLTQQRQRYIGPVYFDAAASEPLSVMAVPTFDAFGDFQGTLVAEVNLKFMWDLVGQIRVGEAGQAYVVDREGLLLAYWDVGRVIQGEKVSDFRAVDAFMRSSAATAKTLPGASPGIDGARVVSTYVPLGTPDWAVIVEMPWEEAYRTVFTNILYSLLAMVVVGIGASVIGVTLARRLAAPLVKLTGVASQIAEGSLDMEATVAGAYEVARLAEAFNSMTGQLRSLINDLEARVLDRTRRLESVAVIGEQLNAILNPDALLREALDQIMRRFGYGRADFYLLDASGKVQSVATSAATEPSVGESAAVVPAENSLVMEAVRTRQIMQTGSVSSAGYVTTLTNAPAEMAVPILQKGEVLGVLSVQADQASTLDSNDASLLRSLTNQIAVALSNARLFDQMMHSKEEAEKAKERADEARAQVELQMWQTAGQAQLSERIANSQGISILADHVIKQLCQYLQVQVGALYMLEGGVLYLRGCYAHSGREHSRDRFALNEGLVGEAASGGQMYRLSDIPEDALPLASSFGEIVFRHSVAAPFSYEGRVLGAVEIGALREFTPAQLHFLETAMERVGVAFSTAITRAQVDELLAKTQQMAEELQVQSEELRVANEELESQTESLIRSEGELREKQTQLESVNAELEEKAVALQEQQSALNLQNQELKAAQDELERKAQELAQASKYKSEFLANMSHELRTPLNSLLILASMLRKNEGGNLTADQVESLSVIHNSGRDLLDLINEILDLSKIEAGRMEFSSEPLSLRDLKDAMATQFAHVAEQKGLEFEARLGEGLPARIVGDVQRISQIVKNLLSNAFKFTERGGVYLEIGRPQRMPKSMPASLLPERTIAISVRDTGIGIPEDKQSIIFEAFQQADGGTSRKYGGTGLGLSISRELAFRMGGMIAVFSVPGEGSTFILYLPEVWSAKEADLAEPVSQPVPPTPVPQTSQKPVSVSVEELPRPVVTFPDDREQIKAGDRVLLIVEDDVNFARIVCDMARRKAFKCLVAGDGEGGLSLVKTYHPDAVLLDLRLPGMSGWSVLQQLKDNPDTRHIPVHIMSVDDRVLDAYKRGAMGFLTKPVSVEDLSGVLGKIEQFIEREVKSLLLVEDDVTLRRSVKKLLEGSDVEIIEVGTGQQSLDTLRSTRVDCMILDLSLPDMSGFDVLHSLHDDETIPKCPVIVYTGQSLTPEEHQQLQVYADSVIVKEAKSPERLLDETSLFLHRVVADMPVDKQRVIKQVPDRDAVLQGRCVLVVDDDMRNTFALSKLLREKGISVQVAADGKRALELLDKLPEIDLVLIDIMMPVMDGYETIRRIRSQGRFRSLPILALTAKAMKGDREKCLEAGANDYLPKPVDEDRLFSMLRVWLYR